MPIGEFGDQCAYPFGVVVCGEVPVNVEDFIVPGRHHLAGFGLGGIQAG